MRPARPLAQNPQAMAQPTWVEMQIVLRDWSRPTPSWGARMMTVSIRDLSPNSRRSLSVTSADCRLKSSEAGMRVKVSSSQARRGLDRLVISSQLRARFL